MKTKTEKINKKEMRDEEGKIKDKKKKREKINYKEI